MRTSEIKTYKFKEDQHSGFEVLPLSRVFLNENSGIFLPHRTDFYHLIFFKSGVGNHVIDFKTIPISAPCVLFVNKNMVHYFDSASDLEATAIIFTEEFYSVSELDLKHLKTTSLFNDPNYMPTIKLTRDSRLTGLWMEMEREYGLRVDKNQSEIFRHVLTTFLLLAERELEQLGNPSNLQSLDWEVTLAFQELVNKHFRAIKKVSEYSKLMGITDKRLSRATYATLGRTPKQLFNDRVILETKRLLAHSNDSIKEISYELGFDEPTNFVKYFKKYTLVLPSEFRENHSF